MAARSGNTVLAPFLPGFGPSESLGTWPASLGMSEWIEAFLHAAGVGAPSVVAGHSLGGGIAASYAAQFPGRTERLFLLSSVGGHVGVANGMSTSRSVIDWTLSLPMDLFASRIACGSMISMVGAGLVQLCKDPIGLWRLSRIARNYQLLDEMKRIIGAGTKVFVVGALGDKIITRDAVMRLANYASVEPIWVSGTHSWISTDPHKFVEVLTTLR